MWHILVGLLVKAGKLAHIFDWYYEDCVFIFSRKVESCSFTHWEFTATDSNAIIWKTKTILPHFYCIFGIWIEFWTFWKKRNQPHILSIFEVTDPKRYVYINASYVLLLKTFGRERVKVTFFSLWWKLRPLFSTFIS